MEDERNSLTIRTNELHTTHYTLHTAHHTPHTTHCILHTTHHTLYTAHYSPHTTLLHTHHSLLIKDGPQPAATPAAAEVAAGDGADSICGKWDKHCPTEYVEKKFDDPN